MRKFTIILISLLTAWSTHTLVANNKFVVVIDPGHGGRDGGAARGKIHEKNINLGVGLALGKLIENNYKDVKVVYTRNTDKHVELGKRSDIANKAKANLFISIHTNATEAKSTKASGAETYILGVGGSAASLAVAKRENSVILQEEDYTTKYQGFDPNSTESYILFEFMTNRYLDQSLELASYIQSGFRNIAKRKDRGVQQQLFLVLKASSMPSVLIELGFVNNITEAKYLNSELGQNAMARSIYAGFQTYKTHFDKMQGNGKTVASSTSTPVVQAPNPTRTATPQQGKVKVKVKVKETATATATQKTIPKDQIEYRIQFLISKTKLPANSTLHKGLSNVSHYEDGGLYKYTYGSTTDYNAIVSMRKSIVAKFSDCFIVKFKNGVRVVP